VVAKKTSQLQNGDLVDYIESDGTTELSEENQVWTTQVSKEHLFSYGKRRDYNRRIDLNCEQINSRETDEDQENHKRTALPSKRTQCPPHI
jgi:hypothetical protein